MRENLFTPNESCLCIRTSKSSLYCNPTKKCFGKLQKNCNACYISSWFLHFPISSLAFFSLRRCILFGLCCLLFSLLILCLFRLTVEKERVNREKERKMYQKHFWMTRWCKTTFLLERFFNWVCTRMCMCVIFNLLPERKIISFIHSAFLFSLLFQFKWGMFFFSFHSRSYCIFICSVCYIWIEYIWNVVVKKEKETELVRVKAKRVKEREREGMK